MGQGRALRVTHGGDLVSALELLPEKIFIYRLEGQFLEARGSLRHVSGGVLREKVLIQLQPQVGERIRREVVISDSFRACDALVRVVQFDIKT